MELEWKKVGDGYPPDCASCLVIKRHIIGGGLSYSEAWYNSDHYCWELDSRCNGARANGFEVIYWALLPDVKKFMKTLEPKTKIVINSLDPYGEENWEDDLSEHSERGKHWKDVNLDRVII
jgi:hypothetical protein